MAHSISNFNLTNGTDINFSSFHFATDYVRKNIESKIITSHDLSKNRSDSALQSKAAVIQRCSKYLISYLEST